jgi:hypothetical protein
MSVGNIITLGFGEFSNVNFLPTLGFGEYATPPVDETKVFYNIGMFTVGPLYF